MSFKIKHKLAFAAIVAIVVMTAFQNCSDLNFGVKGTNNKSDSGGNAGGYSGKTFVFLDPAVDCEDGSHLVMQIDFDARGTGYVIRENCLSLRPRIVPLSAMDSNGSNDGNFVLDGTVLFDTQPANKQAVHTVCTHHFTNGIRTDEVNVHLSKNLDSNEEAAQVFVTVNQQGTGLVGFQTLPLAVLRSTQATDYTLTATVGGATVFSLTIGDSVVSDGNGRWSLEGLALPEIPYGAQMWLAEDPIPGLKCLKL